MYPPWSTEVDRTSFRFCRLLMPKRSSPRSFVHASCATGKVSADSSGERLTSSTEKWTSLLALPRSILKRNSWERWSAQQPLKQESAMHMKIIRTKMRYFSKFYCHTVLKRSQGIRRFRLISFREFCLACIATQRRSVSDRRWTCGVLQHISQRLQ